MRGPVCLRERVFPQFVVFLLATVPFVALAACGDSGSTAATSPPASRSAVLSPSATPSKSPTPLPAPSIAGTIAFTKSEDGRGDLYLIHTDGSGLTRLTTSLENPVQSSWSPDGRSLAYTYGLDWYVLAVRLINADGSGGRDLHRGVLPAWSPDGGRLVFLWQRAGDGNNRLSTIDADGTGLEILVDKPQGAFPEWGRDGRIYYIDDYELWSVEADGSGIARVSRLRHVYGFALSPDARTLVVYQSYPLYRLVLVPASGGGKPVVLLKDLPQPFMDTEGPVLSWSPDGKAIVFAPTSHGDPFPTGTGLYIINADGSGLSMVPGEEHALDPAWRPE
jgi:Tol biopolymer transport system component